MGITFIALCISCLVMAAFLIFGNQTFDAVSANAERAKVWVYIAAVILALGHFWPS